MQMKADGLLKLFISEFIKFCVEMLCMEMNYRGTCCVLCKNHVDGNKGEKTTVLLIQMLSVCWKFKHLYPETATFLVEKQFQWKEDIYTNGIHIVPKVLIHLPNVLKNVFISVLEMRDTREQMNPANLCWEKRDPVFSDRLALMCSSSLMCYLNVCICNIALTCITTAPWVTCCTNVYIISDATYSELN